MDVNKGSVVVSQLAERSFTTPKVRSLNSVIGKFKKKQLSTVNCIEKTKIKKKRPVTADFKKKKIEERNE